MHINQILLQLHVGVGKVGLKNHLCVPLRVFSHCPINGKNFQIFRLRDAAAGVGLVGILITGNADGLRKSGKSVCHRGVISRHRGIFLVKLGTSYDYRSLETIAS